MYVIVISSIISVHAQPRTAQSAQMILQELFSRNGLTFWLEKPTSRQSSCSCSVTYLTMSAAACVTGMRWMAASRRSCSTMPRCCCRLLLIRSMTAVSERPMVNAVCFAGGDGYTTLCGRRSVLREDATRRGNELLLFTGGRCAGSREGGGGGTERKQQVRGACAGVRVCTSTGGGGGGG